MGLDMTQTVQGFYQAGQNGQATQNLPVSRLTHIVGSGQSNKFQTVYLSSALASGGVSKQMLSSLYGRNQPAFPGYYGAWDNPTWTLPAGAESGARGRRFGNDAGCADPSNQGCVSWGAVIFSTTVKNNDDDGLLDVWKTNRGYCDAVTVDAGTCSGARDPGWVDLPEAVLGTVTEPHKDVFVQLDYMCSSVTAGSCDTSGNNYSYDPRLSADRTNALQKVVEAFGKKNVTLHVIPLMLSWNYRAPTP